MKPEREERLLRDIANGSDVKRRRAIEALAGARSDRAVTALIALSRDPQSYLRQHALEGLGRLGDPRAAPHIIGALSDPEWYVRFIAAQAAAAMHLQGAAESLRTLLREDPETPVREACARALGQLQYAAAIPDLLAATYPGAQGILPFEATRALCEIGTPEATEALLDEHTEMLAAWMYFITHGERRALPRMRKFLRTVGEYGVGDTVEQAYHSGEPSLVKAARAAAERLRIKLRPARTAVRWGHGTDPAIPSTAAIVDDEWLQTLASSGWLDEVPPAEARRIKRALRTAERIGAELLASGGYDAECIENSGDYTKWVVAAYQKASFGELKLANVKDRVDWKTHVATVSFTAGRKKFSRTFRQSDDYVADGFHAFMNKVLAETGQKKRFYILETGDQTVALAYVTPKTFGRARKLELV